MALMRLPSRDVFDPAGAAGDPIVVLLSRFSKAQPDGAHSLCGSRAKFAAKRLISWNRRTPPKLITVFHTV